MSTKIVLFFSLISLISVKSAINGTKNNTIKIEDFPYVAFVSKKINLIRTYTCTGSIITKRWVLTVAHCMQEAKQGADLQKQGWVVRVGMAQPGKIDIDVQKNIDVNKYIQHFSWYSSKRINDIALLYLDRELVFNKFIRAVNIAVPLPAIIAKINSANFKKCTVIGWKKISPPGELGAFTYETRLHKYDLNVIDIPTCLKIINENPVARRVLGSNSMSHSKHMCAYNMSSRNPCVTLRDTGDSGGPLVCDGLLYGVVSWPFLCSMNLPCLYTRVDMYYAWILSTIQTKNLIQRKKYSASSPQLKFAHYILVLYYILIFK